MKRIPGRLAGTVTGCRGPYVYQLTDDVVREERTIMKAFTITILALTLAAPSFADVTINHTMNGKALGFSGATTGTTYIKGNRMRSDAVVRNRTQTTIFDLDAQKMYMFDSRKKQADVWDMAAFAAEMSKSVDMSGAQASFQPNGQTREIAGHTATGYDVEVSMQAGMGGSPDMAMTVTLTGPVWIVEDAPGAHEYASFYSAAVEKGWIFSDPRAAKAQPGQAKAMAEMYRQIAEAGGIAYESDVQIKMSGSGPMAAMMAKMGNASFTTVVDSVETGALSDDLFAPPADYQLKAQK